MLGDTRRWCKLQRAGERRGGLGTAPTLYPTLVPRGLRPGTERDCAWVMWVRFVGVCGEDVCLYGVCMGDGYIWSVYEWVFMCVWWIDIR